MNLAVGEFVGAADMVVMAVREQADQATACKRRNQRCERRNADACVDQQRSVRSDDEPYVAGMQRPEPPFADPEDSVRKRSRLEPGVQEEIPGLWEMFMISYARNRPAREGASFSAHSAEPARRRH